jgi:hypothetical protein
MKKALNVLVSAFVRVIITLGKYIFIPLEINSFNVLL